MNFAIKELARGMEVDRARRWQCFSCSNESNRMKLKLEYRFLILRFKIYPKILFEFSVVLKLYLRSGNCIFGQKWILTKVHFQIILLFLFVSNDPRLDFSLKERFEIGSHILMFNIGEYKISISIKKEFKNW